MAFELLFLLLCLVMMSVIVCGYFKYYKNLQRLNQLTQQIAHDEPISSKIFKKLPLQLARPIQVVQHKIAQLKEKEKAERFNLEGILSNMMEGVLAVGLDGKIISVNEQLLRFFSLSKEPIGQTVSETFHHPEVQRMIQIAIRRGSRLRKEILLPPVDTSLGQRILEMNTVPMLDEWKRNHGVVAVFHDLTPIKKFDEMHREFVANVSHELRTPLSVFKGYIETMLANPQWLSPEAIRIAQVLERHSDRLNALVQDLLTLSRLEFGQITLYAEPIDVRQLFEELEQDWIKIFAKVGATLQFYFPVEPLIIHADRLRLIQVFSNLIENALKFSKESKDKRVEVGYTLFPTHRMVQFFVKDEGIGIPHDKLPHIFDRFFRVDPARSREFGGTGLGLTIVRNIILLHKGKIFAESKLGIGTRIYFTLPTDFLGSKLREPLGPAHRPSGEKSHIP